jgi:hypothetical protein
MAGFTDGRGMGEEAREERVMMDAGSLRRRRKV